jgi:small subunit ribosomal protein S16
MPVVIRMKRLGTKRKSFARIVVTDSRNPRDGRFIEEVGHYDMRKSPHEVKLDKERISYWLKVGALPSPTVKSFLRKEKIV